MEGVVPRTYERRKTVETERRLDSGGEEGVMCLASFVSVVDTGGAHAAWRRIECLGGVTWMIVMTRGITAHSHHSTMIAWNNISISVCFCLSFFRLHLLLLLACLRIPNNRCIVVVRYTAS